MPSVYGHALYMKLRTQPSPHIDTRVIQITYSTVYESEDLAESSVWYTIYVHIVHEIFTARCYTRVQYSYDTLYFCLWQRNLCPDHIQWNFLKILSRFITLRYMLFGEPTVMVYSKGTSPNFSANGVGMENVAVGIHRPQYHWNDWR